MEMVHDVLQFFEFIAAKSEKAKLPRRNRAVGESLGNWSHSGPRLSLPRRPAKDHIAEPADGPSYLTRRTDNRVPIRSGDSGSRTAVVSDGEINVNRASHDAPHSSGHRV